MTTAVGSGAATGAIYDRGYRPYDGPRGGRRAARAALFRASLRRALGLRRSWRQKVAPFTLLGIAVIPAVVNVGVKYLTRNTPASEVEFFDYREYLGVSNTLLVFVALTAPDLFCPDRRQRVLPLYFSRPLTGADYVVARTGAVFGLLYLFTVLPQVVLFVGQMLVSDDGSLTYFRQHTDVLWKVPVAAALFSLFYSVVCSAIASLTARRITGGAAIVGFFLVTSAVAGALTGDPEAPGFEGSAGGLLDLLSLPMVMRDLVFLGNVDPEGFGISGWEGGGLWATVVYAAAVLAAVAMLLIRYDQVER